LLSFHEHAETLSRDLLWHTRTAKTLNEQPFSQRVRTDSGLLLGVRTIAKLGLSLIAPTLSQLDTS
jgi:hypothetical protein